MGRTLSFDEYLTEGATMPFEGEKHAGTIIEAPFRPDVWREDAKPALKAFFNVIKAIAGFEKVWVCVGPEVAKHQDFVESLKKLPNVQIVEVGYDDSWARDNVPVFVKTSAGKTVAVDFGFNAWGGTYNGLYDSWERDNSLGKNLCEDRLGYDRVALKDFILEGGSIHTNGKGTLLVTSECLLSPGRNPKLSQAQIEETDRKSVV